MPGTAAPITTAASRVAGLRFTFLSEVSTDAVLSAAQAILGASSTNGMAASAEPSPNPASYLRILVFTPTLVVDDAGVQMRYATLIQRIETDPSNPMSAMSMIAMSIVSWAPTPPPATPVATTAQPLPSEEANETFPAVAVILIAMAVIAFFAVIAVSIWFWYSRRLIKKDAEREREEKERAHQREVNASRMAGESVLMTSAAAANGNGDASRRVTFGAGAGSHETMALPTSALAPEREFALPQPQPTYGDDDGAAYRVRGDPAGQEQYSPEGSDADDDANALMVSGGPHGPPGKDGPGSGRSTAVGSNAGALDVAMQQAAAPGPAARRADPAAGMDLNQDVELDMIDGDDDGFAPGTGRIALSDDDDDGGGAGNPIF
jgi:type II secretory pathway pseudopilin PulG